MEPVTVVVPVLRRPQNAEPFMASLREAVPPGTSAPPVIAVANRDDQETAEAWRRAGATVGHCDEKPGSFGQKANLAAHFVTTDWMFLVGDDVKFHAGWLEAALAYLPDHICVVGTNDLGTPAVQSGQHATHMLLRMDYIHRQGASWDGPGKVAGPYRHWWTDNEMVLVAQRRNVWAFRAESVVEHLHPYFAKADHDEVYVLGEEASVADELLFYKRLAQFEPELAAQVAEEMVPGG